MTKATAEMIHVQTCEIFLPVKNSRKVSVFISVFQMQKHFELLNNQTLFKVRKIPYSVFSKAVQSSIKFKLYSFECLNNFN